MNRTISTVLELSIALTLLAAFSFSAVAGGAPRITKEELKSMLADAELVIVDVRRTKDWNASEYKIKDAVRVDPDPRKVDSWASRYPKDKTIVVY